MYMSFQPNDLQKSKRHSLDHHQQVTPVQNSQRSPFGGDTSGSLPEFLDAETDATSISSLQCI